MHEDARVVYTGWAYIVRSDDLKDCWVAHCLDLDVVTQGHSPRHALDMIHEAVALALVDDLNHGLDPRERPRAPAECWEPLLRLFKKHSKVQVGAMDATAYREFAVPMTVVVLRGQPDDLFLEADDNTGPVLDVVAA